MKENIVVLKFGGSSVAKVAHWETIFERLHYHLELRNKPVLVLSALKNVSNRLEDLLNLSLSNNHDEEIEALKSIHYTFSNQLGLEIEDKLAPYFNQLSVDCLQILADQLITPKLHARVLAIGELLSTTIGREYLARRGMNAKWLDVRQILQSITQKQHWSHYLNTECDYSTNSELVKKLFPEPNKMPKVVVTQGFIASDENGDTVLLGREGSDTSAAYLAAKLSANRLEIWTDVAGVYSANPQDITGARHLPQLNYQQAFLMAKYGAKVIHPRIIKPVEQRKIPIGVFSTREPNNHGTLIGEKPLSTIGITAVATEDKVIRLLFSGVQSQKDRKKLIQTLLKQGFDLVTEGHVKGNYYVIVRYLNNDIELPTKKALIGSLQSVVPVEHSIGMLITLIGSPIDSTWIEQVDNWLKLNDHILLLGRYKKDDGASYSILVSSTDGLSISKKLHKSLIEVQL